MDPRSVSFKQKERTMSRTAMVVVLVSLCTVLFGQSKVSGDIGSALQGKGARSVPMYINFQGYLNDSAGEPVDDSLNLTFTIYELSSSGSPLWTESRGVTIENGIFNVVLGTNVYIPDSVFIGGENRWMQLSVEGETLWPRTRLSMVPYAYKAHVSDTATMAWNASYSYQAWTSYHADTADFAYEAQHADTADYALSGAGGGDGNWDLLGDVLYTHDLWGVSRGDAGNKLWGSNTNTHTNLGSACTTGVSGLNNAYVTISGGSLNEAKGAYSAIVGGKENEASGTYSMVGSGLDNTASGFGTTVCGGQDNQASGYEAAVAGGRQNSAAGDYAAISGGISNEASGDYATMGGGWLNRAEAVYSSVDGGFKNIAQGEYSTLGGGRQDTVKSHLSGVLSGYGNVAGDELSDSASVVCGGRSNLALAKYCVIGGGEDNIVRNKYNTIGGGLANETGDIPYGGYMTIGGGNQNYANELGATISGGELNTVENRYATIGGGGYSYVSGYAATLAGGIHDTVTAYGATVGGGERNISDGMYSVIAGGKFNDVTGSSAVVSGGNSNEATGSGCVIGGGIDNMASGPYSVVSGGYQNVASGWSSTVPGGFQCTADGFASFAFGDSAETNGVDSVAVFSWGDAEGTVFIGKDASNSTYQLYVNGDAYATGTWQGSDRSFKTNVRPLESSLELVSELNPVRYTWKEGMKEYGIDEARADVGFIAQDLQDVVPEVVREMDDEGHLAVNYNHITAVNTAAIKELIRLVEAQRSEIDVLKTEVNELRAR
jgi:hypothetical protein